MAKDKGVPYALDVSQAFKSEFVVQQYVIVRKCPCPYCNSREKSRPERAMYWHGKVYRTVLDLPPHALERREPIYDLFSVRCAACNTKMRFIFDCSAHFGKITPEATFGPNYTREQAESLAVTVKAIQAGDVQDDLESGS